MLHKKDTYLFAALQQSDVCFFYHLKNGAERIAAHSSRHSSAKEEKKERRG
jgi:hypothetical protein